MKNYQNLDIHGDLTLRGKFNDDLTSRAGFYSSFFGETAYATDIAGLVSGGGSGGFYGINVKTTTPNAVSVKGIGVIGFSEDFYVTRNAPNTDEVIVNLKHRGVRRGNADTEFRRTRGRGAAGEVLRLLNANIPPDAVTAVGGVCRAMAFGKYRRGAGTSTINFVVRLNGTVIYEDLTSGLTINTQGGMKLELHLLQTTSTTARLYGHFELSTTGTPVGTNSPEIGIGSLTFAPAIEPRPINYSFATDSTIPRTLTVDLNWATAPTAVESPFYHYMSYVEFL